MEHKPNTTMSKNIFEIAKRSPIVNRLINEYIDTGSNATSYTDLLEKMIDELVSESEYERE